MSSDEITMRDLMDASLRAIDASIYALREQVIAGQQASAREHADVRADLGQMRAELGGAREQLAGMPSDEEFARFKGTVYERLGLLEQDLQQRAGGARARESLGRFVVAGCAAAGTLCGLIVSVSRLLLPG